MGQAALIVEESRPTIEADDRFAATLVVDGMIRAMVGGLKHGPGEISIERINGVIRLYAEARLDALCARQTCEIPNGEGFCVEYVVRKNGRFHYILDAPPGLRRVPRHPL